MNHKFFSSQIDKIKCGYVDPDTKKPCKRGLMDHSTIAVCESCGNQATCDVIENDILACPECKAKNDAIVHSDKNTHIAVVERNWTGVDMSPVAVQQRIDDHNNEWKRRQLSEAQELMNVTLQMAKEIDSSIQIPTDIFNAGTVSIKKIKELIDADETIIKKDWELAKRIEERFKHYKEALFRNDQARSIINAELRASHTYLTELANRLTVAERDALQLKDINYKPDSMNVTKVPLSNVSKAAKKKKLDMDEVKKYCRILADEGIPVLIETLAAFCLARNIEPEQASNELRRSIKEGLSMARKD